MSNETKRQKKTFLILENMPASNKGEIAIAQSMFDQLSQYYDLELYMYSPNIDTDKIYETIGIKLVNVMEEFEYLKKYSDGMNLFLGIKHILIHLIFAFTSKIFGNSLTHWIFKKDIWRLYHKTDVFIYGHDSSFGLGGDIENPIGFPIFAPFFARILGKKVIFFSGTIPKMPKKFPALIKLLYSLAIYSTNIVTLREAQSKFNLYPFARKKAFDAADIAYLLDPKAPHEKEIPKEIRKLLNSEQPIVCLTISKIRAQAAFSNLSQNQSYHKVLDIYADFIDVLQTDGCAVLLLPHSIDAKEEKNNDLQVYYDLKGKIQSLDKVCILDRAFAPKELKYIISKCSLLLGMRLHSVIAAISTGVPCAAISYRGDPRIGMVDMCVGEENILLLDSLSIEVLIERYKHLLNKRNNLNLNHIKNLASLPVTKLREML